MGATVCNCRLLERCCGRDIIDAPVGRTAKHSGNLFLVPIFLLPQGVFDGSTRAIWCALLFLVAAILTPAVANESDSEKAAPADPTGTWKWERKFNDNTAQFALKLNWDGKRLRGKYSAFDQTSDIEEAKLEKDQISFLAKREFNGNRFEVKFNGKVEPDDLVGKITVDFGNGPQDFDWDAKRVEPGDVVGVWDLQLKSPEGAPTRPSRPNSPSPNPPTANCRAIRIARWAASRPRT